MSGQAFLAERAEIIKLPSYQLAKLFITVYKRKDQYPQLFVIFKSSRTLSSAVFPW
jgi:hypothetical protein